MRPVSGEGSTSSGRSIGVAPDKSAAARTLITTSPWFAKPAREVQGAVIEQVAIGDRVLRVEAPARHELVDVFEFFVITHVRDDVAGLAHDGIGTFVLEASERGALARHGARVVRVDFHHPAEA